MRIPAESTIPVDWSHLTIHGAPEVQARYRLSVAREVVLARIETLGGALVVWVRDPRGPSIDGLGVLPDEVDESYGRPVAFRQGAEAEARAAFLVRCFEEDWLARTAFDELAED